jgi:hypothetical protein
LAPQPFNVGVQFGNADDIFTVGSAAPVTVNGQADGADG